LIRMHVGLNLSPFFDYVNRYKYDAWYSFSEYSSHQVCKERMLL
jgi:acyl-CoA-binding protein